nr:SDR family NAD(P)-dependent oxidoreductase [Bacillota bacterium]
MNVTDLFSLKGKTAVVTGGSGLYGRQMVEALALAGAEVYTASRNLASNEEYAKKMRDKGLKVYAGVIDQGDENSIKSFLEDITKDGKKIDILVNNSVLRTMRSVDDDAAKFDESMRVNATGIFMISRAFGDHMAENGGGSIINIGSYMGILGPDDSLYKDTEMTGFIPDYFFHKGGM